MHHAIRGTRYVYFPTMLNLFFRGPFVLLYYFFGSIHTFFLLWKRFSCTLNAPQRVQSRYGGSLKCDNTLNGYYITIIISARSGRRCSRYSPLHYPAGIFYYSAQKGIPQSILFIQEIFLKKNVSLRRGRDLNS